MSQIYLTSILNQRELRKSSSKGAKTRINIGCFCYGGEGGLYCSFFRNSLVFCHFVCKTSIFCHE
jgi:hypothetical protein